MWGRGRVKVKVYEFYWICYQSKIGCYDYKVVCVVLMVTTRGHPSVVALKTWWGSQSILIPKETKAQKKAAG